jgi:hypothetical protein
LWVIDLQLPRGLLLRGSGATSAWHLFDAVVDGKLMMRIGRFGVQLALGAALAFGATGAQATTVITDNPFSLFNATGTSAARLTEWFGKGSLTLTSIFDSSLYEDKIWRETNTRVATSPDVINAAVAGKGPTFTTLRASDRSGRTYLIGWYNPINGVTRFGGNAGETARDAFIFNFRTDVVMRPIHDPLAPDEEIVSNVRAGFNIFIYDNTLRSLYSISDGIYGNSSNTGFILADNIPNDIGGRDYGWNNLEVYSISVDALAAVPEPATWTTMLIGFGLIGGVVRSSRRRTMATCA